jgi:D-glycero-D-manno-heptose 1,7-bisphosphate phosphatase
MAPGLRPAVFLDRDGILNRTVVRDGIISPPHDLEEFDLLPGVAAATRRLTREGWILIVVTNQPDVARGKQTPARVEHIHNELRTLLPVHDVLVCFHDNSDGCGCRKPKPGLLLEAARRWRIDTKRSFMVGDRWVDIVAGQGAGCKTVLVERPYSGRERCEPDRCVVDLTEAADWIIQSRGRGDLP